MLKGSTVKEVNVCFVDKLVHSNSLVNVQPEENCRIDENVQVLEAEKKSAWTGLDRVDFEKISSKSQCPNRKIGVDRSRQK